MLTKKIRGAKLQSRKRIKPTKKRGEVYIVCDIAGLYQQLQPKKGTIYDADICLSQTGATFCIIDICGKKIALKGFEACKDKVEEKDGIKFFRTSSEFLEVIKMDKCPICGTDECAYLYIRKNSVIGCDCCVHPVDIWDVPDDVETDDEY